MPDGDVCSGSFEKGYFQALAYNTEQTATPLQALGERRHHGLMRITTRRPSTTWVCGWGPANTATITWADGNVYKGEIYDSCRTAKEH